MPVICTRKPSTTTKTVARRNGVRSIVRISPPRSARRSAWMSSSSRSTSASGSVRANVARASSTRPLIMYQRGVSGSRSSTISTSAAGIEEIASIQRQCSPPASAQATK